MGDMLPVAITMQMLMVVVWCVIDNTIYIRALNEGWRRLQSQGEGTYKGLLLVESAH